MKKSVFTLMSVAMLAGSLVACSEATIEPVEKEKEETVQPESEAKEEVAEEEAAEEEVEESEAQEEKTAQTMVVGDTVQYDDMEITVNSAKKFVGGTDVFDTPENDYFVILDVTVENVGNEPFRVSSLMNFELYDSDAYTQDMAIFLDLKGTLDGEVGAGRKMAGEMGFDVVESESYEFIFQDPFASGQAIWSIPAEELQE